MTRRTRSRVAGRTVGSSLTTRLTVMCATPAARATSTMVGGRLPCAMLDPALPGPAVRGSYRSADGDPGSAVQIGPIRRCLPEAVSEAVEELACALVIGLEPGGTPARSSLVQIDGASGGRQGFARPVQLREPDPEAVQ